MQSTFMARRMPHLLCALMLLWATVSANAQVEDARLYLSVSNTSPTVGEQVTVEVRLDTGDHAIRVAGVFLLFDRNLLRFDTGSVNTEVFTSGVFTSIPTESSPGMIAFSAGANTAVSGAGIKVAELTFTAISSGDLDIVFSILAPAQTSLVDNDFEDIPFSSDGAELSIQPVPPIRLYIEPPLISVAEGNIFEVDVMLDPAGATVGLVDVYVQYNESDLAFLSASANSSAFNLDVFSREAAPVFPGVIRLTGGALPGRTTETRVATLQFEALNAGEGLLRIWRAAPMESAVFTPGFRKRPISSAGACVLIGATTGPDKAVLALRPRNSLIEAGESVVMEVRLDANETGASVVNARIDFDPGLLEFVRGSLNRAAFEGTAISQEPTVVSPGIVSLVAESGNSYTDNDLLVATLEFRSLVARESEVEFLTGGPNPTTVRDSSLSSVDFKALNSTVRAYPANAPRLYIAPVSQYAPTTGTMSLDVMVDTRGASLAFASVYISQELEFASFTGGSSNTAVFNNGALTTNPELNAGLISFSVAPQNPVSGDGIRLATLNYDGMGTQQGLERLVFVVGPTQTHLNGPGLSELAFVAEDGFMSVVGDQPFLMSLDATDPSPTAAEILAFSAIFSAPVVGVDVDDFELTLSGSLDGAAVEEVSGSGTTYNVSVSVGSGEGELTLALKPNPTIVGEAAQPLLPSAVTASYLVDRVPPSVTLTSAAPSVFYQLPLVVQVDFSEQVGGLSAGDFDVNNGSAGTLTGGPLQYFIEITPEETGEVTVSLPAGSATDIVGNANLASNVLTRTYQAAPSVVISSTAPEPTSDPYLPMVVTFSSAVTGFSENDVVVSNGNVTSFEGEGAVYTFDLQPVSDGTVTVDIPAGVAVDSNGFPNEAAATLSRTVVDVPLSVVLTSTAPSLVSGTFGVTARFNRPVTGFMPDDLVVEGGSVSAFSGVAATYTFNIVPGPSGEGQVTVQVPAGVATDASSASNVASPVFVRSFDLVPPEVASTNLPDDNPTNASTVSVVFTFSESMAGSSGFELVATEGLLGAAIVDVSGSGATRTVTVDTGTGDGMLGVELGAESSMTDQAGNPISGLPATSEPYIIDRTPPVSAVVAPSGMVLQAGSVVQVSYEASDNLAGVERVRLFFRLGELGPFLEYGDGFSESPILFDAGGSGTFHVYTVAVDAAGNEEEAPEEPDAIFTLDATGGRQGLVAY